MCARAAGRAGTMVLAVSAGLCALTAATRPVPAVAAAARPPAARAALAGVSAPGCSTAVAFTRLLSPRTSFLSVPGDPFGMAATDGWAFSALSGASTSTLYVFSTTIFGTLAGQVHAISIPGSAKGAALSPDGKYLLVAADAGTDVIDVARAEAGDPGAVLGTLTSSGLHAERAAFTPDGKFVFVTLEDSAEVAVYNFQQSFPNFGTTGLIGYITNLAPSPVGMAVSPDGLWLYVTSEAGRLTVIRLDETTTSLSGSVVNEVPAGCDTVRVITSADGSDVWVAAANSDAVLLFSAAELQNRSPDALRAWIRVGHQPESIVLVNSGTLLLVADSDRSDNGMNSDVGVIDVAALKAGGPAWCGEFGSGRFPRDFAMEASNTTLLLGNFDSDQIESIDTTTLPSTPCG